MIQPNGNFQQGNRRFAYFNLFGIGSFPSGQAASHSSHITVGCPRRQGGLGILGNWGSPQTHIVCQPLSDETEGMDQQTATINEILKPFSDSDYREVGSSKPILIPKLISPFQKARSSPSSPR